MPLSRKPRVCLERSTQCCRLIKIWGLTTSRSDLPSAQGYSCHSQLVRSIEKKPEKYNALARRIMQISALIEHRAMLLRRDTVALYWCEMARIICMPHSAGENVLSLALKKQSQFVILSR